MMGSSVVMAPLWSVDAKRFAGVADVYHHHRSLQMQRLLANQKVKNPVVFTFALPGAMVSDGFLLTEKLLKDGRRPQVLVYGLSPRDLMDDLLTGETRTCVFQQLMTLGDLPRLGGLYLSSWGEKFDFIANNICFLYGKRARYQQKAANLWQGLLSSWKLGGVGSETTGGAEKAAANFLLDANRKQVWQKSIEEYKLRYGHFNARQFEKQKRFLEKSLSVCRERGIKVYLVNMPLSADNLKLIDPSVYKRYRDNLTALTGKYGCSLIDMQQTAGFADNCFYDTVHLNAQGGEKLLSGLAEKIVL
jgi:hypothetical protein